jgi:hypothetical protein
MTYLNRAQRRAFESKNGKSIKSTSAITMSKLERDIYNSAPKMIHEDAYFVIDCILCGKEMKSIHDTHNAHPLSPYQTAKSAKTEGNIGRCCSACNTTRVLTARKEDYQIAI